ncbi:efflux RND transporter periplasmic adaptor subunit [Myxococcota bacterium]|nr:efflux RND transporter periplasmic adaptor subunit [Myxococcota bacterium]
MANDPPSPSPVPARTAPARRAALPLLLVLGLLAPAACGDGGPASPGGSGGGGPPPTPVRVAPVAASPLQERVEGTGVVEARSSAEIRPEASGPLAAVAFRDGEKVRKGQVLARLRDEDARAQLAEAEARLALAQNELQRAEALFGRNNASQADVDRARADRDLAAAQTARARETLRRTVIVAPFDGTADRRMVAPGEVVAPATVVTRLESLDDLAVDLSLPEGDVAAVAVGQAARIAVDALPGQVFEGEVSFVGPRVSAATRTVPVRVSLPGGGALRPGLTARISIVTRTVPDALLVPTEAIVESDKGPGAYVVGPDGKATLRPVETGTRLADRVRVVSGLSPGDAVVVEGLVKLRPGATVRIVDGGAGGPPQAAGAPGEGASR